VLLWQQSTPAVVVAAGGSLGADVARIRPMRIGIVGGAERIEARLRTLASAEGHELEFHPGHMNGSTGAGKLKAIVERCDLLVVVTDVNSHAAVLQARDLARRSGRPLRLIRRLGTAQLRLLLN
jgi:hypothetical protein